LKAPLLKLLRIKKAKKKVSTKTMVVINTLQATRFNRKVEAKSKERMLRKVRAGKVT
jgi:hypothetical protein